MGRYSADPTPAVVDSLEPWVGRLAVQLINYARTQLQLPLIATSGRRTAAEQQSLVRAGRSQTQASAHLQGRAVDFDLQGWNRDAVPAWVWEQLGPAGERLGFRWGGRWRSFVDVGHFEI